MNKCSGQDMQGYHQFFDVPRDSPKIQRTKVVCAFCGQVRVLWVDGNVEITRQTGAISLHDGSSQIT